MSRKTCALCGKFITYTFWVCADCEQEHGIDGVDYTDWPQWIKEMVKHYRRQFTIDKREIAFSAFAEDTDPLDFLTENNIRTIVNR